MSEVDEAASGGMDPSSESFWEINQYKRTVKRIDDGLKLCTDFMTLTKERGEIELSYSKSLKNFSKKWAELIEKGPEYGNMLDGWKAVLQEADRRSELHSAVRDRMIEEVYNVVKLWSKEAFHKSKLSYIKESRDMEESFKRAQKPWAKLYAKVDKTKKDFHNACRQERSAMTQEKNAQSDGNVSPEQMKRLAEKVDKCREDREKCENVYKKALNEINDYQATYREEMCQVFKRCQDMELKRMKFFKEMFAVLQSCLDLSKQTERLEEIYEPFLSTIQLLDLEDNLKWWDKNCGTEMSMQWPSFEEYVGEFRRITKKQGKSSEPVTLVGLSQGAKAAATASSAGGYQQAGTSSRTASETKQNGGGDQEEPPRIEAIEAEDLHEDMHVNGVSVKALYDYTKQEDDELSFKKGDVFEKLGEQNEQGWCKGRKDGVIGLYPADYAVVVS